MLPITSDIISEMDLLYVLYKLAEEYKDHPQAGKISIITEEADFSSDTLHKRLATRERILKKTASASDLAAQLLRRFETVRNVPAAEKALIEEKQEMILDLLRNIQNEEQEILVRMNLQLKELREEIERQKISKSENRGRFAP